MTGRLICFGAHRIYYPIRAKALDKEHRFRPSEKTFELFNLDGAKHGWERFGENHSDTVLRGYIEGPWLTKHNNKYYLQYAAPGTEFNVYGDGAYISDSPLGPYTYMPKQSIFLQAGWFYEWGRTREYSCRSS